MFSLNRADASYPIGEVRFYIDPTAGMSVADIKNIILKKDGVVVDNITIPRGTLVRDNEDHYSYRTAKEVNLSNDGNTVSVVGALPGSTMNVASGVLTTWEIENTLHVMIHDYILVSNPSAISTGQDTETDENFRFRIVNHTLGMERANINSLRLAALSVPGVSDVVINNYKYGIGTVGMFLISESPIVSQGLLDVTQTAVNNVIAAGERCIVSPPNYKAVGMDINIELKPGTPAGNKDHIAVMAKNNIIAYINNLAIGESFVSNRLIDVAFDSSDDIFNVDIQNLIIGNYNIETGLMDDFEYALNIVHNVGSDEKFVTNEKITTVCWIN